MILEAFEKQIWLSTATQHGEEMKYIQEAFDTNWITTEGTNIAEIEGQMCEKLGCEYAVSLASGTSALHLAIRLAGVKEGDTVFCSDMSIVGPRPLLVKYIPRYTPEQRRRHDVRPGLTGLAQINGRNAITWEERFAYDIEYVDSISFIGDIKIILGAVKAVFNRRGITSETSMTMEEFMGIEAEMLTHE